MDRPRSSSSLWLAALVVALVSTSQARADERRELQELRERIAALEEAAKAPAPPEPQPAPEEQGFSMTELMKKHKVRAGLRVQGWYQYVEDGARDGHGDLHDFMVRRFYLYMKAEVIPTIGLFGNIAADRIGQDGLDHPSVGLGTGIAVRDAWAYWAPCEAFELRLGRMYVPFTRSYGTKTTFSLLTLDLPFNQGGGRGGICYASKVGRDDGVFIMGNPLGGLIQYRAMVSEGVESSTINPHDHLRVSGRISLSLLEPETKWFNKGTYLGKRSVLSLSAGVDFQPGLTLGTSRSKDNLGWTVDAFFDYPVGAGAVTLEAAFIRELNVTHSLSYSWLESGDDADIYYVQAGYLLPWALGPGRLQPYLRYEALSVKRRPDTVFPCLGVNYYLDWHDAKLTLDWTLIDQKESFAARGSYSGSDQSIVTVQLSVGL